MKQGVKEIEHLADPTQGEVRIGTIEPVSPVLSEIICRMTRHYPRITLRCRGRRYGHAGPQAARHSAALDVVLTRWNTLTQGAERSGGQDPLYVDARHHGGQEPSPGQRQAAASMPDLTQERWALSRSRTRFSGASSSDLFQRRKLPLPRNTVTTTSIFMRLNLMANGHFLSVLPTTILRHPSNTAWLRALKVDLGDSTGPIATITIKGRRSGGALKLFLEASRGSARLES